MTPPSDLPTSGTVLVTACSGLFLDHYLDMLDSLADVGLSGQFDIGLIDLGMTAEQQTMLLARGIRIVPASWPIDPPLQQNALHLVAFAAKPFARDFFPGYQHYVWIDADMWAQTDEFWGALIAGADTHGVAVPIEVDAGYGPMTWRNRAWMLRHYVNTYGLFEALQIYQQPVVNNGLFALRADAPQWTFWQAQFKRMVARTQRALAIDQLALIAMCHLDKQEVALLDARHNWVCSLGTPQFDAALNKFVKPGPAGQVISVMHITSPSRGRKHSVHYSDGKIVAQYLHRPGGRFIAELSRRDAQSASLPPE